MVVCYGFGEFGELLYSNSCSFHPLQTRTTSIIKDEQEQKPELIYINS